MNATAVLYMNENLDVCIGVHVDGFLTDSRSEVSIARRIYSESNRLDQEKHRCNLVPGALLLPWIYARCRIGVHRGKSCSTSQPTKYCIEVRRMRTPR